MSQDAASWEKAPHSVTWRCPECGPVRPEYIGDSIGGFRVRCTVCETGEYAPVLPWGGSK